MEYNRTTVSELFATEGEIMFVLESDREYELHTGNVELDDEYMKAEGVSNFDEYIEVVIPYDVIEHHYTHKAV